MRPEERPHRALKPEGRTEAVEAATRRRRKDGVRAREPPGHVHVALDLVRGSMTSSAPTFAGTAATTAHLRISSLPVADGRAEGHASSGGRQEIGGPKDSVRVRALPDRRCTREDDNADKT